MTYHLPSHISFGQVGARTVLLDLNADRYFLLGDAEAAAMHPGNASDARNAVRRRMAARGFLERGPGASVSPVAISTLARSAFENGRGAAQLSIWEAGAARYGAALGMRCSGLARMVENWRLLRARLVSGTEPATGTGSGEGDAGAVARGYAAARLLVPARRLCIPDSFALARILWKRRIAANIYFGVQLAPFTAHCWVQHGDLLLSDPLDKVTEFSPVFRL